MNVRGLEARLRRVEGGRRGQPEAWVDRYLRAHPDSGLPHAEREGLRGIAATGAERDWFHRAMLARSAAPGHEPWWLLELSPDAIRRLGAVWRAEGPDPAREAWRVVVEHVQATLAILNECLGSVSRDPLPPEQEDRDLARYWSLANGAWPSTGLGAAMRGFVAGGPVPGAVRRAAVSFAGSNAGAMLGHPLKDHLGQHPACAISGRTRGGAA